MVTEPAVLLPPVEERPEWVRLFAEPADLTAEPEADKAVRLLRMFRAFNGADERIMVLVIDGQPILFGKIDPSAIAHVPQTAEGTV